MSLAKLNPVPREELSPGYAIKRRLLVAVAKMPLLLRLSEESMCLILERTARSGGNRLEEHLSALRIHALPFAKIRSCYFKSLCFLATLLVTRQAYRVDLLYVGVHTCFPPATREAMLFHALHFSSACFLFALGPRLKLSSRD